jgi:hypothetical protein
MGVVGGIDVANREPAAHLIHLGLLRDRHPPRHQSNARALGPRGHPVGHHDRLLVVVDHAQHEVHVGLRVGDLRGRHARGDLLGGLTRRTGLDDVDRPSIGQRLLSVLRAAAPDQQPGGEARRQERFAHAHLPRLSSVFEGP